MTRLPYDEFGLFHENAEEFGIPFDGPPVVERVAATMPDGRTISALRFGTAPPELVLLHGGAQNAHTYDTVVLALQRPVLCIDLPGHGHSDGGAGGALDPVSNATDIAEAIAQLAPTPTVLVGMSLGGLTALALAAANEALVRSLVLIDITPGVNGAKAKHITDFVQGPATFDSFDDLLERTQAFNPSRSVASLRRGILHNAEQLADGTWQWRYARHRDVTAPRSIEPGFLWDALGSLTVPVTLVRGMGAGSVVDDDDEARFVATARAGSVVRIEGAGHSVQGDRPLELAALLSDVVRRS
jgi:pimeloyl-ACP methyl ester carboxylesterase